LCEDLRGQSDSEEDFPKSHRPPATVSHGHRFDRGHYRELSV